MTTLWHAHRVVYKGECIFLVVALAKDFESKQNLNHSIASDYFRAVEMAVVSQSKQLEARNHRAVGYAVVSQSKQLEARNHQWQ
jgi:hypothetical protein